MNCFRRVLQAMHQAKIEETIAQAKALKKAMKNGEMATMVMVTSGIFNFQAYI